ncbi:unnamed protein product [Ceratitis capitata]|uniref:(Mediterranean fruit fly) hypothetical protein n=1 Tax=Ceratitis capitata TaxID=7213 RepID=A0A811V497_CERCA|nr:unnamed protein product [Ceratitis capitata]
MSAAHTFWQTETQKKKAKINEQQCHIQTKNNRPFVVLCELFVPYKTTRQFDGSSKLKAFKAASKNVNLIEILDKIFRKLPSLTKISNPKPCMSSSSSSSNKQRSTKKETQDAAEEVELSHTCAAVR